MPQKNREIRTLATCFANTKCCF